MSDPWADAEKPYCENENILGSYGQFNEPDGPVRKANPNIRVLISIGGWSFSQYFSVVASTHENRETFSKSVADFVEKYKFDGVDIDWEFPVVEGHEHNIRSPDDGKNFSLLVESLKKALGPKRTQYNESYLLTLATSAAPNSYNHLEIGKLARFVDWFNIMAYDFTGPWSDVCHHHCNLLTDTKNPNHLSADKAIYDYISSGARNDQIVLGVPFYGRGFSNVHCGTKESSRPHKNVGLGNSFKGLPSGKSEKGVFQFHELFQNHLTSIGETQGSSTLWHRIWNDELKSVNLWNSKTKEFISYEDNQSIAWKCYHVKSNGLGGIMIWELYGDHDGHLLDSVVQGFTC
ncbi:hypothetical protein DSO57_1020614 [Entomophthora muscae]|nr:hypothetical protein DSO57_1020614 [Entomophthora muscae]